MSFLRRLVTAKEVNPDLHLAGIYPDPKIRRQVFRDMYSCEYDAEPFVMYRVKKNLVRTSWRTDDKGFVCATHASGRAPLRVLLLGDSAAFGLGLSHPGENIAAQLEKVLLPQAGLRERGLSIVNGSQPGYALLQQVLYSRFFLAQSSSPNIVLLWFGFNDVHNTLYSPNFGGPIPVLNPFTPVVRRVGRALLKPLPRAVLKLLIGSELSARVQSGRRLPGRRLPDDREMYVSLFADLKALWAGRGARLLVLLQPYLGGGSRRLAPCEQDVLAKRRDLVMKQFDLDVLSVYADAYQRFEGWLKEAGCDYLNLVHALDGQTEQMFLDRVHLAPRAVERVASRVGRAILESGAEER